MRDPLFSTIFSRWILGTDIYFTNYIGGDRRNSSVIFVKFQEKLKWLDIFVYACI